MARDVFISYSTKDKALANKICAHLESRKNISCWIAHRDILPGADWPESIVTAIGNARVMLLLFTSNANESSQMARELARADNQRIPVIALRTREDVEPGKMLAYFLSTSHWLDIFPPPLEKHMDRLGTVIEHLLADQPAPQLQPPAKAVDRRGLISAGAAALVPLGAAAWWFGQKSPWVSQIASSNSPGAGGSLQNGKQTVTVLPLKNLSNDPKQEYFSDGQTDAITAALVQLQGLTLVAPQSAFLLGKNNANLQTVGEILHVNYVIDGTVNWTDNQVRVAARLIEVATSKIAWAGSFNRLLSNVMSLQDDIAKLVAVKVQQALELPAPVAAAHAAPPALGAEAGTEFLQAKSYLRQRAKPEPGGPLTSAATLFESVLKRSPTYLPAEVLLVQVYGFIAAYHALFSTDDVTQLTSFNAEWLPKAEAAALQATALAPDSPLSIGAMGLSQNLRGNVIAAEELFRRSHDMAASNADVLHLYSLLLLGSGYVSKAAAMRKKLQELEPLVTVYVAFNIVSAWVSGDSAQALRLMKSSMTPLPAAHPYFARLSGLVLASQGKFREASEAVLRASTAYSPAMTKAAGELLLAAAAGTAHTAPDLGFFSIFHVYSKTPERALDYFENNLKSGFWAATEPLQFWHPSKEFAALRATPRFRNMVQGTTQLADLWRARGKPDLCQGAKAENFCPA